MKRAHTARAPLAPRPLSGARACLLTALGVAAFAAPFSRAVYAPIPALEQGRPFTIYLGAATYYDSNVFGAEAGAVDSMVYQFQPSVVFNASLGGQTFTSASYRLSLDYIPDRPGETVLDSHELTARVAHTFTPQTEFDLSQSLQVSKNPESLLPGVGTVSTDQSFRRSQTDARFSTSLTRRTGLLFKARYGVYDYDDPDLGRELDRAEALAGLTAVHSLLPTWKASAEYRHQRIQYDDNGGFKDKRSHFLLAGTDYALNDRTALSVRLGAEFRNREGERNQTSPYVELGAKRDYARGSFVSLGFSHSVEETSSVALFTDARVNRVFLNWNHVLTPKLTGSTALIWEPTTLQGRSGISPDRSETNLRVGLAAHYRPRENLTLSATVDLDRIASDQPGRDLRRNRIGVAAKYAF